MVRLARQPGRKEARYSHVLCGQGGGANKVVPTCEDLSPQNASDNRARIELLEEKVEVLSSELDELKKLFLSFKEEFE